MPAFEPHVGRNPNTPKIAPLRKFFAEAGAENLSQADCSAEVDSTILVQETVRGSKLDGDFKKKKGMIPGETWHTISVLPNVGKTVVYSKRNLVVEKRANCHQWKNDKTGKIPTQEEKAVRGGILKQRGGWTTQI